MTKIALMFASITALFFIGCGAGDGVKRQEIAEDWVTRNQDLLEDHVVDLILGADFGYKLGNELIKNAIRDDVTRQVRGGLDWSFESSDEDSSTITATASIKVEIQTKAASSMSGLIKAPALEGTITASQPFELTIFGETISRDVFPSGGRVSLDLRPR